MKITDFENIIREKFNYIKIDEMVLSKNHIKHVYGHSDCTYYMWDSFGRAYIQYSDEPLLSTVIDTREKTASNCWERQKLFDLF